MKIIPVCFLSVFLLTGAGFVTPVQAMQTNNSIKKLFEKYKVPKKISKGIAKLYKGYYKKNIDETAGVKIKALKSKQKYAKKMVKGLDKYIKQSEDKKVDKEFVSALEKDVKILNNHIKMLESKIRPLESTRAHLIEAIDDWGDLNEKDKSTFEKYYKETYRLLGMNLSELVKAAPDYSELQKTFKKAAAEINSKMQKITNMDENALKALKKEIKDSLEILTAGIPPA